MKVLLNDGMDNAGLELFEKAGIATDTRKRNPEELAREIGEFDALGVRSATKVTRDIIMAGSEGNLVMIARAGVGIDNVDVEAASEYHVLVKIAPNGNTNPTAEMALGLMYDVSRNISRSDALLRAGYWRKKQAKGVELSGKTLGIIGCGRIGQRLSELVRPYMTVIGYDPNLDDVKVKFPNSTVLYMPKDEVIARADYLSLHAGGNAVIIGQPEIDLMKPTAYLINASRGKYVDEQILYTALKEHRIAGAGIDVHSSEPTNDAANNPNFKSVFSGLENVVLTPHSGASTDSGERATSIETAEIMIGLLLRGDYSNAVNAGATVQQESKPTYTLFVTHRDVPGAFADISRVLGNNGINIRENPSRQLGRNGSVLTTYHVHQRVGEGVLAQLKQLDIVHTAKSPIVGAAVADQGAGPMYSGV